ncbi:MAG TPA: hypothetical protein VM597_27965, partial [Gemmataceae bacterium]|nr:hypothetical protein [Gemmataceae bacterium]
MGVPTGEVIARPMMPRACGCLCEFQHYAVDKYRAQRLAKFQSTRCPECVAKSEAEQRAAAASLPSKGEAIQSLPVGSQVTLKREANGNWSGTLVAEGATVDGTGDGPQGLTITLARKWLMARGYEAKPAPPAGAA